MKQVSGNKVAPFKVDLVAETELNIFPNPVNEVAKIVFKLQESNRTVLKVYDSRGLEIAKLYEGAAESNVLYKFDLDATRLPHGLYMILLQSGKNIIAHKKFIVIR